MAQTAGGSQHLSGTKRPRPDDDNCDEQPLAKKFGLLHLNTPTNAQSSTVSNAKATTPRADQDSMLLDDTKYTVYIHDLDREIADIESQENDVPFLPRIPENLTSIPPSILSPPKPNGNEPRGNELVLYSEPSSLTVSRDQDCVRRAIIETKARSRKTQAENLHSGSSSNSSHPPLTEAANEGKERYGCDDPMDLDDEL
ncbi:hypothetical protein PHISCL_01136 [Aspergillus sclerotialis]|uniref:Uncharacterized protein n=1 Tax=Aspergillus sclerotialis TaxID=2070753 RepID=A0A3A2ZW08_9EURO|nr:hypothetical protein PHISCL_01136 [Aspergillus sclerotialis]